MPKRSPALPATALRPAASAVLTLLGLFLVCGAPAQAGEAHARRTGAAAAPVVVGHRGAAGHAPENTLAAVDKAHALGADWVETDVQRTRDGELVIMHDTTLDRTTNAEKLYPDRSPWKVGDFTAAEIARLDAGGWYGKQFAGEHVPTLEQWLREVGKDHLKLLLELKAPARYPGVENQTLKELADQGWLDQRHVRRSLVVQSFDADAIRTVHELAPQVRTGFLGTPATGDLADYATFCDEINPPHTDVTPGYVEAVHDRRAPHGRPMRVYTWVVDDAATARRAADAGVDGVISDYPDIVRKALGG
jgi:glycerophosphoryl diester phosphodiesterase